MSIIKKINDMIEDLALRCGLFIAMLIWIAEDIPTWYWIVLSFFALAFFSLIGCEAMPHPFPDVG